MNDFDQELLLDHRAQSHALFYVLKQTKLINKNVYVKFAKALQEEEYIKEN